MFEKALGIAEKFTFPVVRNIKIGNVVKSEAGTYVLVNKEGWFLTCAHLFEKDPNAEKKDFWWGKDGITFDKNSLIKDDEIDLAVGRLLNFNPSSDINYPVFASPEKLKKGKYVIIFGYPFLMPQATYDSAGDAFRLNLKDPFPLPVAGVYYRDHEVGRAKYIEITSKSLGGQSGGPILDESGIVLGIQSRNQHRIIKEDEVDESGRVRAKTIDFQTAFGVHSELIIDFLKKNKIEFKTER